jgi:putative peptide zinc metalloprotease protein
MIESTTDAADQRSLPFRMRRDLQIGRQGFSGRDHWVVKDPVSLRYFHLLDEEYTVLRLLDGCRSLDAIKRSYDQRFAPRRLSLAGLQNLLGHFHSQGLLLADLPRQGKPLLERQARQRRRSWLEAAGNLLAIRLPGIDPEPWLAWLTPRCRWLFSPSAAIVWVTVLLTACVTALSRVDDLAAQLPTIQDVFTARTLAILAVTLTGAKVLHELAHGVACKAYGGECHEMGLMLLVFTPCLYCDVSDAWMLPGKRQRIAVSAAGIYTDLFVAAVGLLVWSCTHPGVLNSLGLSAALLGSVGTILFNGNPLLRFDGYYIFADLVEIPNLQTRARDVLSQCCARWLLGVDLSIERAFGRQRRRLLLSYAVAALAYRCVIVIGIYFLLTRLLAPYRLQVFAQVFVVAAVLGMFAGPLWRLTQFVRSPLMRRQIQRSRVIGSGLIVLAGLLFVLLIPLPCRVRCPVLLELRDADRVYVTSPGTLLESVPVGQTVAPDQVLGRLADPATEIEVLQLTSQRNRQIQHLQALEARRGQDPQATANIPAARQTLRDLEERLQQLSKYRDLLTLRARQAGVVIPPPSSPSRTAEQGSLAAWAGTPLQPANRGCYLDAGTLFCLVGNPRYMQAVAIVEQPDVDLVQPGQAVRICLNQAPTSTLTGTVQEIARIDLKAGPQQLIASGELAVRSNQFGTSRPLQTAYQARIELQSDPGVGLAGAPGRAKIYVAPQSLARRLTRYFNRTFTLPP